MDPHTAEATRATFGDRKFFQDWPEFRQRYFAANLSIDAANPLQLRRLFIEWAKGAYVESHVEMVGGKPVEKSTGRLRSVVSGEKRPDPGYEHLFLIDPAIDPGVQLPLDRVIRVPANEGVVILNESGQEVNVRELTVQQAAEVRHQNMKKASELRAELAKTSDSERRGVLEEQIKTLGKNLKYASEALGVAAGLEMAEQRYPGGYNIEMPSGSGVPDILRIMPDGRVVCIECKGGDSPLGTRVAVDGIHITEQGNREYIRSVGHEMAGGEEAPSGQGKPGMEGEGGADDIEVGGKAILKALNLNKLEYLLVRQPFDPATGAPLAPEIAQFDVSGTTASGTAPAAKVKTSGTGGKL